MISLPHDIEILTTEDGSPTLAFRRSDGYVEKMHHAAGALSESLYIYHQALEIVSRQTLTSSASGSPRESEIPIRVLSLGLGLGYNEMITVAEAERRRQSQAAVGGDIESFRDGAQLSLKIFSFEALDFLRESFSSWVKPSPDPTDQKFGNALSPVYDEILNKICTQFGLSRDRARGALRMASVNGSLELRREFPRDSEGVSGCNLVYYDAYSNKMNAGLWQEEMLVNQLGSRLAPDCVLATYAATGSLNRALKKLGFRLVDKPGFHGKRQSTLAIRGRIHYP